MRLPTKINNVIHHYQVFNLIQVEV